MDREAVERWIESRRNLTDSEIRVIVTRMVPHSLDHQAAAELLDRREKSRAEQRAALEARRFRLLLWVGILTLLTALLGVALTAWQTFRSASP